jgi:WD40 repeat protein
MKMSPDGLSLVIGDLDGNIHVLDMMTLEQTACIEAHDGDILTVDFGQSVDMG